jgi:hypothetical protein
VLTPTLPARNPRILVSNDWGDTWTPFSGSLPSGGDCLFSLNRDYAVPGAFLASTCQGAYRWTGDQWQQVTPTPTAALLTLPTASNEMWAIRPAGEPGAPLQQSTDQGVTWQEQDLPTYDGIATLAVSPHKRGPLFATLWPAYVGGFPNGSYLRRLLPGATEWQIIATPADQGANNTGIVLDDAGRLYLVAGRGFHQLWRAIQSDVADPNTLEWELWYDFGLGSWVNLLAAAEGAEGVILYAVAGKMMDNDLALYRSLNGGKTWERLSLP